MFIARSGYTGEFGFELFTSGDNAQSLWQEILDAGQNDNIIPCGLACRDSLRAGAGLPLAGHDIGNWPFVNNPWLFALPFTKDKKGFSKNFLGCQSLLKAPPSYTYAYAGYNLRKIDSDSASVIDAKGATIGKVLTCVTDMALARINTEIVSLNSANLPEDFTAKGLSCGFIKTESPLSYGDKVMLQDIHRKIEFEIVKTFRPDCSARKEIQVFL